jgi:hypothetical protein
MRLTSLVLLLGVTAAIASASGGLKWSPSITYEDGSPVESTEKVVYLVYDANGKQVASTFDPGISGSKLPTDGCYRLKGALYSTAINGIVPASESTNFSAQTCIAPTPPPKVQKRVATPLNITVTP